MNNEYIVRGESLHFTGKGIAKINEKIVFVKNLLPAELAKIKVTKEEKRFSEAEIIEYLEKKERLNMCPFFNKCGGCDFNHLAYDEEIRLKEENLSRVFNREVKVEKMDDPSYYRNKVNLFFDNDGYGFYEKESHNLVNIKSCMLINPTFIKIADFISNKKIKIKSLFIRTNQSDDLSISFIIKENIDLNEVVKDLITNFKNIKRISYSINNEDNLLFKNNYKILYENGDFLEEIADLKFLVSDTSFMQVNQKMTEKLYKKAIEMANINKDDIILDAYCGIGTISLFLAKSAKKVYGIEIVKSAIENANKNKLLNKITNAEFILGDVTKKINDLKNVPFTKVVVDPPRKGLDKPFIKMITDKKIKEVVYISCNYQTLLRDIKIFNELGYELKNIEAFDMFARTNNVETVATLVLDDKKK